MGTYKNGTDAKYNYTYDANGNITKIWRGNGTFASATEKYSYSYDAANQLVRENLYYGSGNSNNVTYTYTYDHWGNITAKKQYAYTTASELAEPIANMVLSFNGNSPINGGTVPNLPSNISAAPGTTVTIPNVTPQLNCSPYIYEFVSWNTKANGTGTTYRPGQSITLNSNITLYARWRLVYAPPGGGEIRGEAPEKPEEPERAAAPYPVKAYIYNYADSNWKDKLTSIETYNVNSSGHMVQATVVNLTYDSMGNPTNYRGFNLAWEGKQLQSCGLTVGSISITYAYRYNEDGLRTQKIGSLNGSTSEATNYYYNGSVLIGMQKGNIVQRFSYDAQGKVVAVDYSENGGSSYTTYYYLRNAQGDIVKLIDNGGDAKVEYTYDSWGKLLSTTGDHASGVGSNQPFRYRGYVYDTETGWYYLQSRYYNPETCRFISSDVLLSTGQGVIGHNAYAYCGNNPIANSDPLGTAWWHWAIAGALVVGAAVACVVTCGGAAPAIAAVACVANGVTAATTSATVAAGVFIGSSTALATSAAYTLSTSGSVEEFLDQGSWGTVANTFVGGAMGGVSAYSGAKSSSNGSCDNLDSKTKCFVAGTLIKTDYSAKAIEDIAAGDYVYATDPETGESGYKRVVQTFENETYELINVKVDGETITTTPTHPFYVPQKGWTEAVQLRAGDILVTCNGEYVVVELVQHELLETPITVYNFEVEDFHTYYVAANEDAEFVLVHNKCRGTTTQKHHMLTNKSKVYTPKFNSILNKYGLDINKPWNIKSVSNHLGRHTSAYHEFMLKRLTSIDVVAAGNKAKFLMLFNKLSTYVENNPYIMYK